MNYELKRKLKKFRNQADKLYELQDDFLQGNKLNMNVQQGEKAEASFEGVDESVLVHAFVLCRPFLMQNDINAESVSEEILEKTDYQEENIEEFLSAWKKLMSGEFDIGANIQINDTQLTEWENFQRWLNEEYFHPEDYNVDQYKDKGLQEIKESHPWFAGMSKFQMIDFLQRVFSLILWLDVNVIQEILDQQENE